MSDEEFSRLLSLPLETYLVIPYGYDMPPSLSSNPSSQYGEIKTRSPASIISEFEAQIFRQGAQGVSHPWPDTSMSLLADFPTDCMDFQDTNPSHNFSSPQTNATSSMFDTEHQKKAPSATIAGYVILESPGRHPLTAAKIK